MDIHDTFTVGMDPAWQVTEIGEGVMIRRPGSLHLSVNPTDETTYSDTQITEYDPQTRDFKFKPPLRLTVKAYSSLHPGDLKGTAGFGFWNHPFQPGQRGFRLPKAIWFFFAAPPSDMQLAEGVPGQGWKASTFNATGLLFKLLLPLAPIGMLLMRIKPLYRLLWSIGQRALGVSEMLLDHDMLTRIHTYTLEWRTDSATFSVDGETVHTTDRVPDGPLGFIAWMDNQYAVVTPQGRFESGLSPVDRPQALVINEIQIESL